MIPKSNFQSSFDELLKMESACNYLVSIMVDALAEHYYKAEILLNSLVELGHVPPQNIVVHCVDRVGNDFKDYISRSGLRLREVAPYLDGAYCNKLQQLPGLMEFLGPHHGIKGVLLMDVDMIVLRPVVIPDSDKVSGKVVDGANPPLPVIKRIFLCAGVNLPSVVTCDWGKGATIGNNFNGGFLYFPVGRIDEVCASWRKHAEWLFSRKDLFGSSRRAIHVDQVSLALALTELREPVGNLSANYNYPVHQDGYCYSLDLSAEICVLHYHRGVDYFGLIKSGVRSLSLIDKVVGVANEFISKKVQGVFFDSCKIECLLKEYQLPVRFNKIDSLMDKLGLDSGSRKRLVLHVGTLKTGTTSLQTAFDKNRNYLLKEHRILYPGTVQISGDPKHQWLLPAMLREDESFFVKMLRESLLSIGDADVLVLSTEAIFNHWWDFTPRGRHMLSYLKKWFDVEVYVYFRSPDQFASSLYCQYMMNPPVASISCYCKGFDFDEMMKDDWFARHLDYIGFVRDVALYFGDGSVKPLMYTNDVVADFFSRLDVFHLPYSSFRKRIRLSSDAIDLLRVLNPYVKNSRQKDIILEQVIDICGNMVSDLGAFEITDAQREKVLNLSAKSSFSLREHFKVDLF